MFKSISVFLTQVSVILITTVGSIVVTRILGPTSRGVMELLVLTPNMIVAFGNLGINFANTHYVGSGKHSVQKVLSNSLSLSLMLGSFLLFIAFVVFFSCRDTVFENIPVFYAYIAFFVIPCLLFIKYVQYIFLGKNDIRSRNLIILLPAILNVFLAIVLVAVIRMSVLGVLIATFVSTFFSGLLCLYYAKKKTKIILAFDYGLFVSSVKFGLIPFFALVVMNLIYKADIYLIKYYLNNEAVGLYTLSVLVLEKMWLIPSAVGLVLFSRIPSISADAANELTSVVTRVSFLLTIASGVILFLSAGKVIPFVFGDQFKPAVKPLLILTPGIVNMSLFLVLNYDLTARGKANLALFVFGAALILNIGLNMVLIPIYAIEGAAFASSVSYSLGSWALLVFFARMNSIPPSSLILPHRKDFLDIFRSVVERVKRR